MLAFRIFILLNYSKINSFISHFNSNIIYNSVFSRSARIHTLCCLSHFVPVPYMALNLTLLYSIYACTTYMHIQFLVCFSPSCSSLLFMVLSVRFCFCLLVMNKFMHIVTNTCNTANSCAHTYCWC